LTNKKPCNCRAFYLSTWQKKCFGIFFEQIRSLVFLQQMLFV